jgi:hypothetical protein
VVLLRLYRLWFLVHLWPQRVLAVLAALLRRLRLLRLWFLVVRLRLLSR